MEIFSLDGNYLSHTATKVRKVFYTHTRVVDNVGFGRLGPPLGRRQPLVLLAPPPQTLGLVDGDGGGAELAAAQVAEHVAATRRRGCRAGRRAGGGGGGGAAGVAGLLQLPSGETGSRWSEVGVGHKREKK